MTRLMFRFAALLALLCAPRVIAGVGQLTINVSVDAALPKQIYVAAVPSDRPLNSPAYERIIDGTTTTFSLPQGAYRFVAAAPDYASTVGAQIFVAESSVESVELHLTYLSSISGYVVDKFETPIPQALVGLPGAFRLDLADNLSRMGRDFMRRTDVAETDANGLFVLPVRSTGSNFIYVEAAGYSPNMLGQVHAADGTLPSIRLDYGASLEVRVNGSTKFNRLRLIPADVTLPATLSFSSAIALWSREVSRNVRWESLPPGEYDVCFGRSPDQEQEAPRCAARVNLAARERRVLTVQAPHATQERPPTHLDATLVGVSADDLKKLNVTLWSPHGLVPVKTQFAVRGKDARGQIGDCAPGETYVLTTDSLVGTTGVLPDCRPLVVAMLPRRTAFMRLRAPLGVPPPEQATVIGAGCPEGNSPWVAPFKLGTHQEAAFPIPAGCSSLHVVSGRLFSGPLPKPQLRPNTHGEALIVELRIGGSVTGTIRYDDHPRAGYQIELTRPDGSADALPLTSRTTSDGWFFFPAVPDGAYVLVVKNDAEQVLYRSAAVTVRPQENVYVPQIMIPSAPSAEPGKAAHVR